MIKKFIFVLVFACLFSTAVFSYSFVEFPLLGTDDYYKGCNFICRDYDNNVYYYTSTDVPSFVINGAFLEIQRTAPKYILYVLSADGQYWDFFQNEQIDNTFYLNGDFINPEQLFLCSDVYIEYYDDDWNGYAFYNNSTIPAVNFSQLQFKELEKINAFLVEHGISNGSSDSSSVNVDDAVYYVLTFCFYCFAFILITFMACRFIFGLIGIGLDMFNNLPCQKLKLFKFHVQQEKH